MMDSQTSRVPNFPAANEEVKCEVVNPASKYNLRVGKELHDARIRQEVPLCVTKISNDQIQIDQSK